MSKKFAKAASFPLHWPDGFPVTKSRESSRFNTTLAKALENVQDSLQKFGKDSRKKLDDIIISSNYSLTSTRPDNPGVAVYFTWDGERTCIPVDRYRLVEDNLQAIYHCIEAKRTMLRHGGINLVKAAFRGYAALPDPESLDWRAIIGYQGNDPAELKRKWKERMREHHPDRSGGDREIALQLNMAYEVGRKELEQRD